MSEGSRELLRPQWNDGRVPDLRSGDTVRYASLTGTSFRGQVLRDVTFFGCRLNGASFAGSELKETRFVGCYASEHGDEVVFGSRNPGIVLTHTHIGSSDVLNLADNDWPLSVIDAASRAVDGDNVERYRAVHDIGSSGYKPVAPFLVSLLDDEEWDVRAAVIQALASLRNGGFPDDDEAILRAVVEALGDENQIVSMHATDLITAANPPLHVLADVVRKAQSDDTRQTIVALRAITALARVGDPQEVVATRFDGHGLLHLASSESPALRAAYLHALGAADLNVEEAWVEGLRDVNPAVRIQTLRSLRLLSDPPPARTVEPLLGDSIEEVRVEALFTLGQLADYDHAVVASALKDPSEQVRQYAAMLLDSR